MCYKLSDGILAIFFEPEEICAEKKCLFEKRAEVDGGVCYGRRPDRDYPFSCNIEELKVVYKRGAERKLNSHQDLRKGDVK